MVAVAVTEVTTKVAVTEKIAAVTVLILRVESIVEVETTTTEVPERTRMDSSLRARRLSDEVAEVAAAEVIAVVIAATTEVAATEEAEIVPRERAKLLSNNKTLSELDRAVNSLSSDEMKITNLEGVRSFRRLSWERACPLSKKNHVGEIQILLTRAIYFIKL